MTIAQKNVNIQAGSISGSSDAFGRLRVSTPASLFDSQFQYNTLPLLWETTLTAGGTVAHLPNESSIELRVAASGDSTVRQSRQYVRYQPGKSQLIIMTGVLGAAEAGVRRRFGYFDASNGFFLEQTVDGLFLVKRTNITGTPTDTRVAQADWNVSTFQGSLVGLAGRITLNATQSQILVIDLQWLGVGRVRVGFEIDGILYYAHEFLHTNVLPSVYMTTANLPIRYELEATGAITGTKTMKQICSSVTSEGGFDIERGIPRGAGNGITTISVTTRRPVFSIRSSLTFNSIVNRGLIFPEGLDLHAATNSVYWELVLGGTLTGASFASAGSNSIADVDVAATAISGGEVLAVGFAAAGTGTKSGVSESLLSRLPLTIAANGTAGSALSIVCTGFGGAAAVVAAGLNWRELY